LVSAKVMENFHLEATPKTPGLNFNSQNGKFEISGRSIPENSIDFYKPLLDWLDAYLKKPLQLTHLTIKLEYFNTSSSKCMVDIFRRLEKLHSSGNDVQVEWFYEEEDEDMQESGEDFKEIIKLPIKLVLINSEE